MSESTSHSYEPAHERALRWLNLVELPDPRIGRILRLTRKVLDVPVAVVRLGADADAPSQIEVVDPEAEATVEVARHELEGPDGQTVGEFCLLDHQSRDLSRMDRDVLSDLAEMVQSQVQRLALETIDDVTTLPNRRGFLFIAGRTLALRERAGAPASLVTLELWGGSPRERSVDHSYELRAFARLLSESFRDSDVAARLGGNEFCVLLSPEHEDDVEIALGRLEKSVDRWNAAENGKHRLRFRSNIVDFDVEEDGDLDGLLQAADEERAQPEPPPTVGGALSLLRLVRDSDD